MKGTAVLALNGELQGHAPGGDGRARRRHQSRISGNGKDGEEKLVIMTTGEVLSSGIVDVVLYWL